MAKAKKGVAYTPNRTEQAARPRPSRRTVCPLCKRPQENPEARRLTDRVLLTSDNPYVVYAKMHGIEPDHLAEKLIRHLDTFFAHDDTDPPAVPGATGILLAHGMSEPVQAWLIIQTSLEGRSDRSLADALGIDHKTVAVMARFGLVTLRNLLHGAGIRRYHEDPT